MRHGTYDLSPVWNWFERAAEKRGGHKQSYKSTRNWNTNTHLLGIVGEWVFGKSIGVKPNTDVYIGGDGGFDFERTDVKASAYFNDPILKLTPDELRHDVDYIALVAVNVKQQHARYVGWETMHAMRCNACHEEFVEDFGYGPRVVTSFMREGVPPIFSWGDE